LGLANLVFSWVALILSVRGSALKESDHYHG